jgi:hypothetical protein
MGSHISDLRDETTERSQFIATTEVASEAALREIPITALACGEG